MRMKGNAVSSVAVEDWIDHLRTSEWLIPQFQRDFVWGIPQIAELAESVLSGRPIGMVTIWEQPDESDLPLEEIAVTSGQQTIKLSPGVERPKKFFAVLDGRQRSQAAAMAFAGLRATDKRSKFAGRFFLDTTAEEDQPQVRFIHEINIEAKKLRREADFISQGLFPLSSDDPEEGMVRHWVRFATSINDPATYPGNQVPPPETLAKRQRAVQDAFDGLTRTKLAVYTVPSRYQLGEICEIFETLNTTGWQVSTVDLIHSSLYADTSKLKEPMLLRDWIGEIGQRDGAVGWAKKQDRPELFVQIVAACYLAEKDPPPPRKPVSGAKTLKSIKAADLLALPTPHWLSVRERSDVLVEALRDFQRVVGDGAALFPFSQAPYPVTAGLYVGLRWRLDGGGVVSTPWNRAHLDSLFRAFFWQNALSTRYDQGFLTKFGTDLRYLLDTLDLAANTSSMQSWCEKAEDRLNNQIGPIPSETDLVDRLGDGRITGALAKAFQLPMRCRVKNDLLNPSVVFSFPETVAELHHIFPKQWCINNNFGTLGAYLRKNEERDPVSAVANLMPLGRASNNAWREKHPSAVASEHRLSFEAHRDTLKAAFIDSDAFELLLKGVDGAIPFWERRKQLIAADLVRRTHVTAISG